MVLIFCLAGCAITPKSDNVLNNASQNTYIKSVFIAYYELEGFTKNNDEKTFKKEISKAFKLSDVDSKDIALNVKQHLSIDKMVIKYIEIFNKL